MTDIAETISSRDYYTQVCFNRALVQLGISAFHQGNLYETQQILSYICSLGKSREENKESIRRFLGQSKPDEKATIRHKTLPYYLHFNIDVIEAVELIASMVLEIPFTLLEGGKITSRSFKKVAYQYERSVLLHLCSISLQSLSTTETSSTQPARNLNEATWKSASRSYQRLIFGMKSETPTKLWITWRSTLKKVTLILFSLSQVLHFGQQRLL